MLSKSDSFLIWLGYLLCLSPELVLSLLVCHIKYTQVGWISDFGICRIQMPFVKFKRSNLAQLRSEQVVLLIEDQSRLVKNLYVCISFYIICLCDLFIDYFIIKINFCLSGPKFCFVSVTLTDALLCLWTNLIHVASEILQVLCVVLDMALEIFKLKSRTLMTQSNITWYRWFSVRLQYLQQLAMGIWQSYTKPSNYCIQQQGSV